jgi:hypothetical protein
MEISMSGCRKDLPTDNAKAKPNNVDYKRVLKFLKLRIYKDERGSLSVVIIGLLVLTVASLMVMTDVATVMVAKRSLAQATEAAAMRGVHTLDRDSYYTGKGTVLTTPLALINNREHPSIPIDCQRAPFDVVLELENWSTDDTSMKRHELQGITLTDFLCDGTSVEISTRAEVKFPFTVPFTSLNSSVLTASAASTNQVQEGFYLFGIRLH